MPCRKQKRKWDEDFIYHTPKQLQKKKKDSNFSTINEKQEEAHQSIKHKASPAWLDFTHANEERGDISKATCIQKMTTSSVQEAHNLQCVPTF